jgi:hypothetical protein
LLLFYYILTYVFFYFLFLLWIIDLPDNTTFDANEFPLLNSLGCTPMHLDRLMQEILKFHGHSSIRFIRGNNHMDSLVLGPSHSKMGRYEAELYKKNSAVDVLLDSMSMSSNSKKEEAAECLMKVLYKKFEECFASVAIEMNLMITKSARILSRHLRQHFVRSLIASESE